LQADFTALPLLVVFCIAGVSHMAADINTLYGTLPQPTWVEVPSICSMFV